MPTQSHLRQLRSLTATIETDVCVVGAGITGLAHAFEARRRGLSVVVVERERTARGASVRSNGQLPFSVLKGEGLLDASAGRARWIELARLAALPVRVEGTVVPARQERELDLLEEIAAEPLRGARMLTVAQTRALMPAASRGVRGGLHATADLRIDPRSSAAALARLLSSDPHARIEWGTAARELEPGLVVCDGFQVRAGAIVVCPGLDPDALPWPLRQLVERPPVRRVQLLRAAGTAAHGARPALATAVALLAQPGIAQLPAALALRRRLELESPELMERRIELSVTPLVDGDLVIGEAGAGTDTREPFTAERPDALLIGEARRLLGYGPRVLQRWSDVRHDWPAGAEPELAVAPLIGVRVVFGAGAVGLALCHVNAARVLDDLLSGHPSGRGSVAASVLPAASGLSSHPGAFGIRAARLRSAASADERAAAR